MGPGRASLEHSLIPTRKYFFLGSIGKLWREGTEKSRVGVGLTRHVWQSPPSKRGWKDTVFFLPQDKQLSVRKDTVCSNSSPTPAAEALGLMVVEH